MLSFRPNLYSEKLVEFHNSFTVGFLKNIVMYR